MGQITRAQEIAENLRQEPYTLFRNDCIIKSLRFRKRCRAEGIESWAVVTLGYTRIKWFGHRLTIPVIHGWGEIGSARIETSRPLGTCGTFGILPLSIKPFLKIKFCF